MLRRCEELSRLSVRDVKMRGTAGHVIGELRELWRIRGERDRTPFKALNSYYAEMRSPSHNSTSHKHNGFASVWQEWIHDGWA